MSLPRFIARAAACATLALLAAVASAADYPAPKEGSWIARDFRFSTGEVMPELRLHYTTVGNPAGEPVLVLHGTTGSGASMLSPGFAGELFGAGQPLDANRYFIILPDAIGHGKSSRPSDGLRAKFPRYTYDDMVAAQHRLVTEHLGIKRLRLVIGNSMGGMHTWLWGTKHPDMMEALVPMACQPTEMAGRNWMTRKMLIDSIRNDPDYADGNYTAQPKAMRYANVFFGITTIGGTLAYQKLAPNREAADKLVAQRMSAPFNADANDFVYQWDASRDYNASPGLERITAPLLAINAADDERNPPELGIMERELKRVKNGKLLMIPPSEETRGHGTTGMAKFWKAQLQEFMQATAKRAP